MRGGGLSPLLAMESWSSPSKWATPRQRTFPTVNKRLGAAAAVFLDGHAAQSAALFSMWFWFHSCTCWATSWCILETHMRPEMETLTSWPTLAVRSTLQHVLETLRLRNAYDMTTLQVLLLLFWHLAETAWICMTQLRQWWISCQPVKSGRCIPCHSLGFSTPPAMVGQAKVVPKTKP